jgi:hypothetical protein
MTDVPPPHSTGPPAAPIPDGGPRPTEFAIPAIRPDEYTDGRKPWDWKTKYPPEARTALRSEAWILGGSLLVSLFVSGFFLSLATQSLDLPLHWLAPSSGQTPTIHIDFRLLMIFGVGCVGGTTFSITRFLSNG